MRAGDIGREAVLSGWVANWRDHGGLAFIDLRDRTGLTQIVFRPEKDEQLHGRARELRSEFCVSVRGVVERRPPEMANPKLPTGQVELLAAEMQVHSESQTPPFSVASSEEVSMEVRLKNRFLDLRSPHMQRNLETRHRLMQTTRRYLDDEGFIEVETPFLTKSTPEGARDYLVPSRVSPGHFYALPQSPQLFKQLLMIGGMDRYFQIVKCFRDEDLRANRQPEFTQIDIEMSFVDEGDVMSLSEGLLARLMEEALHEPLKLPLPRIDYSESLADYGTDAPDLRFELRIRDISDVVRECGFRVFSGAVADGGQVRGLCLPEGARMPRSQVDGLVEWARQLGAGGLAWFKVREGRAQGGIAKFLSEGELQAIRERFEAEDGSLLLFVADRERVCNLALSHLRLRLAREFNLVRQGDHALCWVVGAPAFQQEEEGGPWTFVHHPFTAPCAEDVDKLESAPGEVGSRSYDIVMDGQEIGGGSIRVADAELQKRILGVLGYTDEEIEERFGFFIRALRYGPPPHGGIAFGFDRLVMTILGIDDLRETIAFPKTQRAVCLLTDAPSEVRPAQLRELGIRLEG